MAASPIRPREKGETFSLARYARPTVDLCLSVANPAGGPPSGCFVCETPLIRPTRRPPERPARDEVDAEVRQYQKEQLDVLGYIN